MTVRKNKCPFPWFGGKEKAAPKVWQALGDVAHYVEPFCGSLAVLLQRPHPCNRAYYSETVNDLDGLLVNAWRAIQLSPEETAEHASWPVSEADLHARHASLVRWRKDMQLEHLMGDPDWHDAKMAGWWMWGQSSWIGNGWCSGKGPWIVNNAGRLVKRGQSGISRQKPFLSCDGRGVNRPQLREPGVSRQKPNLNNNGQGVNHAGTRLDGVRNQDWHPMTMPELLAWFQFLSARLRHVRILNGDWHRACTSGAIKTLPVRMSDQIAGVFLDPPYLGKVRTDNLYAKDDLLVADAVHEWCVANGDDPDYRIVLAGFDGEHNALVDLGWREVEWFKGGFLTGGMGNTGSKGHQQHRERLWLSPHCLAPAPKVRQTELFTAH